MFYKDSLLMKTIFFIVFLFLFQAVSYADYPEPKDEYINDFAKLLMIPLKLI